MKKSIFAVIAVLCLAFTACGNRQQQKKTDNQPEEKVTTISDFKAIANDGSEVDFAQYKGKVLLIANTASQCGFTPQYDGLERLYETYKDDGLVVIGFPCDQFGHQEPGSNEEIAEFCKLNHGVSFPLMAKIDVNGENAHPIFQWLYAEKPFAGFGDSETGLFMDQMLAKQDSTYASNPDIKWNFTKFLIGRDGNVVARFEPTVTPEAMENEIQKLL
ncbi:MAG: glutathione peroxidase [Bacteroidales bacterium]|nr:glutathione peroxidase [Bacteroidales bacterium]